MACIWCDLSAIADFDRHTFVHKKIRYLCVGMCNATNTATLNRLGIEVCYHVVNKLHDVSTIHSIPITFAINSVVFSF